MNASLPAAVVVAVLASLWLAGRRRPRPILRSTDAGAVAALNRAQIERLQDPAPGAGSPAAAPDADQAEGPGGAPVPTPFSLPRGERQRLLLHRQLVAQCNGSRDQRLEALAIAGSWRHSCVLPLLRRALRDPDPAVMAAAASAMEAFRGRSIGAAGGPQASATPAARPPRTVARTR